MKSILIVNNINQIDQHVSLILPLGLFRLEKISAWAAKAHKMAWENGGLFYNQLLSWHVLVERV